MSDQQVRDEVMTLVLAGHETTANALTWAWFLARPRPGRPGPGCTPRSTPSPETLTTADVVRLPWVRAVVAETLRLYPPAWTIGRRLTEDVRVDGWTLPAGSLTARQPVGAAPRPAVVGRPRGLPSRTGGSTPSGAFDEAAPGQPRGAWFPFGLGGRVCIGETFAWTEAVLLLATLARRWDPTILAAADPVVAPAVTLRPRDGMPAVLRHR